MRLLEIFVLVCLAIAVLQAAVKLIVVAGLVALVISAIVRPLETFAGFVTVIFMSLLVTFPLIGLPLVVALVMYGRSQDCP